MSYNYEHFGPEYYDFTHFDGPKPGEKAPDFIAINLKNEEIKLLDFKGKWVVLETGSITCPITDSKVYAMDKLKEEFEDVIFILLYTREAHPGENYDAHKFFEEKLERAKKFASDYDIKRMVLVDDIEGTIHKKYGSLPNSVHIINPDGMVVMRGDWNNINKVKEVLQNKDKDKLYEQRVYPGRPLFFTKKKGFLKVFKDSGPKALRDFIKKLPILALMHFKITFRGKKI